MRFVAGGLETAICRPSTLSPARIGFDRKEKPKNLWWLLCICLVGKWTHSQIEYSLTIVSKRFKEIPLINICQVVHRKKGVIHIVTDKKKHSVRKLAIHVHTHTHSHTQIHTTTPSKFADYTWTPNQTAGIVLNTHAVRKGPTTKPSWNHHQWGRCSIYASEAGPGVVCVLGVDLVWLLSLSPGGFACFCSRLLFSVIYL